MTKGIRIAKEGRSAISGRAKDLSFTSEAQSLKISEQFRDIVRSFEVTGVAEVTLVIKHNLGYTPVFRLFVEAEENSGKWYPDSNPQDILDSANVVTWLVKDINEVNIQIIFILQGARKVRYKYWIFEDRLEEL